MTAEELPRFNTLNASCCSARITSFEKPFIARLQLEDRARREGWVQHGVKWICRYHSGT